MAYPTEPNGLISGQYGPNYSAALAPATPLPYQPLRRAIQIHEKLYSPALLRLVQQFGADRAMKMNPAGRIPNQVPAGPQYHGGPTQQSAGPQFLGGPGHPERPPTRFLGPPVRQEPLDYANHQLQRRFLPPVA